MYLDPLQTKQFAAKVVTEYPAVYTLSHTVTQL